MEIQQELSKTKLSQDYDDDDWCFTATFVHIVR